MSKEDIVFTLSNPITYAHEGQSGEGQLLVLRAPNSKQQRERITLQQGFFRALNSVSSSEGGKSEGSQDIKGVEVLALLLSSDVDMVEMHEAFRKLICSQACKIEDKAEMTSTLFDEIDLDDIDLLMGEYLANFILSSVLKTLSQS